MNLSDLRGRARRLSGVHLKDLWPDSDVDSVVNEAYHRILALADWTFLHTTETIVDPDANLEIPEGMAAVRSVAMREPERRDLRPRTVEELDRQPSFQSDGLTWAWAVRDDRTLELWPEPEEGVEVVLRGWKRESELGESDEPVFDEEFHAVVAYEAAARILAEEGDDSGRSQAYREEVAGYLLRMGQRFVVGDPEEPARVYMSALAPADDAEVGEQPGPRERPREEVAPR